MITKATLNFLFPRFCVHCDAVLHRSESHLCLKCFASLPFTHWQFNQNNALYDKIQVYAPIQNAYSLLSYGNQSVSQSLIHALKYKRQQSIGEYIAQMCLSRLNTPLPDTIIPVPIHPQKEKQRGYNQLEIFGKTLANSQNGIYRTDILYRKIHQKSQTHSNKWKRMERLSDTFDIHTPDSIPKEVLLIDDVATTGSTLAHCAYLLHQKLGIEVHVLTMATVV